jgi:uncharacterized protein (DUF1684 family)
MMSPAFVDDWNRWRSKRLGWLRSTAGPASLTTTFWPEQGERLPGIPGVWSFVDGDTFLTLDDGEDARVQGETRSGTLMAHTAGFGPKIRLADRTVQVTMRLGRRGVRVFDHSRADAVETVDVFDPSPSWAVEGAFTPLPDAATAPFDFELEPEPRELPIPGTVSFELAGTRIETTPFLDVGGLQLVFSDQTTGKETRPPSRFLYITPPDDLRSAATVAVDFNRAFLPPCAFSNEFNCPLPPPGHRLPARVDAGESWVRWSPGFGPAGGAALEEA